MGPTVGFGAEQISAFERFLAYGPIGIVGLTLILAVIGLLVRDLDERRFTLIKYVLVTGVVSLVALLVAEFMAVDHEHQLSVRISPLDNASERDTFPEPIIIIDQAEVDRASPISVAKDVSMIVDISRAIRALEQANEVVQQATASSNEATELLGTIAERLSALENDLALAQSSGGTETVRLATGLSKSLNSISGELAVVEPIAPAD